MTRSDRFSFITVPYFLGTVGIVVGLLLTLGARAGSTGTIGCMAIFTGWLCLCLGGTNELLARILAKLNSNDETGDVTQARGKGR